MERKLEWSKYFNFEQHKVETFIKAFGAKKTFSMGLMPIRGPKGFRKLDYEYAEKGLNIIEIMRKLEETHFNTLGIVIKDTDGVCTWDTKVGWNPTERDILGEFCDAGKESKVKINFLF